MPEQQIGWMVFSCHKVAIETREDERNVNIRPCAVRTKEKVRYCSALQRPFTTLRFHMNCTGGSLDLKKSKK